MIPLARVGHTGGEAVGSGCLQRASLKDSWARVPGSGLSDTSSGLPAHSHGTSGPLSRDFRPTVTSSSGLLSPLLPAHSHGTSGPLSRDFQPTVTGLPAHSHGTSGPL